MNGDLRAVEVCARCGHQTLGCPRCGKNDPFLGARIGDKRLCHTFSDARPGNPTCYTAESWSRTTGPAS